MYISRLITLSLIFFSATFFAWGQDNSQAEGGANERVIKIALGDWSPYSCDPEKEQGKVGYIAEIIMTVFKKQGFTVTTELMPFARIISKVRSGHFDVVPGMAIEDAPDFIFSDKPIGMSKYFFFASESSSWNFTGYDSLMALKKMGMINGYSIAALDIDIDRFIENNPDKIYTISGEDPLRRLLQMIVVGRIDAIVDDELAVKYGSKKIQATSDIKKVGQVGESFPVYVGFAPYNPHSREYVTILEDGVKALRESGELQKILDRYGIVDWAQ